MTFSFGGTASHFSQELLFKTTKTNLYNSSLFWSRYPKYGNIVLIKNRESSFHLDGPCERLFGSCTVCPFLFSKMYSCCNYGLQMLSGLHSSEPTSKLLLFVPYTSVVLLVFTAECFISGNNQLTNMLLKKSFVIHFVSCRPFCPFCHPYPLVHTRQEAFIDSEEGSWKELERSNSELSAFEFQNRFVKLTVKVILWENRTLSQKERFWG